jgi:hypothetical protein
MTKLYYNITQIKTKWFKQNVWLSDSLVACHIDNFQLIGFDWLGDVAGSFKVIPYETLTDEQIKLICTA